MLKLAAIVTGALLLSASPSSAHRLSGHPKTLRGQLVLVKRQIAHDRQALLASEVNTRSGTWTILDPLPLIVMVHRTWLRRDLRFKAQLERLLTPRLQVDSCLRALIDREDPSWDPQRHNSKGSGAYGLPQALPGEKMASAGPDWRTNPWTQIRWMIGYVNDRYGGSCNALAFQIAHNYY